MERFKFPIKYFQDNLIFNHEAHSCWACFMLKGVKYDFESLDSKIELLHRISRFISNIGKTAKILIIPVAQDVENHYSYEISRLDFDDELYKEEREMLEDTKEYLMSRFEDGYTNDYEIYIITKLTPPQTINFKEIMNQPKMILEQFMAGKQNEIYVNEIKSFRKEAKKFFSTMSKRLAMVETNAETTQWLIKRMFLRGEKEVELRTSLNGDIWTPSAKKVKKNGKKAIIPYTKDIMTLSEELIESEGNKIKITHQNGETMYQTFMAVSFIPDGIPFPGGEWLLALMEQDVGAEICITIKSIDFHKAIKKIDANRDEIKGQISHVAESEEEIPEELFESKETSDSLKEELKQFNDPMIETSIMFCFADSDPERLDETANYIQKVVYKDIEFKVERPFTDQLKMFYEFIPGSPVMFSDYTLRLPPKMLAGSMFVAKKQLGDVTGNYIGTTGMNGKLVYLDAREAPRQNKSAAMAFLGTLGGGKSFNANLVLYLNVMTGGKGLIIDPKGERKFWEDNLPELKGKISVTTLSTESEDRGKLDPFVIYRTTSTKPEAIEYARKNAVDLAISMITELYDIKTNTEEYIAITEVINNVSYKKNASMTAIIEELKDMRKPDGTKDDYHAIGVKLARQMEATKKTGMASLFFGKGDEKGLSFSNRINILQIQNIQMPEPNTPKEDWKIDELLSTVLMLPIAAFAKKFSLSARGTLKTIIMDESWVLLKTNMGMSLYSFLARMGRSLNTAPVFIGHSAADVSNEGIKAAITYKFCFRVAEKGEARKTLEFMDLEVTDDNIETIMTLGNGQCLFQDLNKNIDVLQFDAVHERLIRAFDTNPTRVGEKE